MSISNDKILHTHSQKKSSWEREVLFKTRMWRDAVGKGFTKEDALELSFKSWKGDHHENFIWEFYSLGRNKAQSTEVGNRRKCSGQLKHMEEAVMNNEGRGLSSVGNLIGYFLNKDIDYHTMEELSCASLEKLSAL